MEINGTLMNYYIHCKRQCYLHGNRINLEDNSEKVKVGKAIHDDRAKKIENAEIAIDNIKLDKLTRDYLTEVKKSDGDAEAARWQLLFYLKVLKEKGIERRGKLEFVEKNKTQRKVVILELTEQDEKMLECYEREITELLNADSIPPVLNQPKCKKCAYYEYCYI